MAIDLKRGVGELKKFRAAVDQVLSSLESGDGGKTKVAAEQVTRGSFGTGLPFAEADGFYKEYNRVHKALVDLSKSLSDQIEVLSIGVHGADVGYDNVDDYERRRFHTINARLDEERDAMTEQEQGQKPVAPQAPRTDSKTGTTDLG
ncbi:hypothetical protein [Streptomyces zhihengii]|uniref:Uncharacterized protein n=1 Tax=Streptomyces zhihengii TaxID=1818004 RepID=A0ABS2UNR6_9ACTN|nr:hypothetical protein [Streptomyces zhihengii]MBM9619013.1 hypothetical protein [Streptomyces zhihengii]